MKNYRQQKRQSQQCLRPGTLRFPSRQESKLAK